MNTIIIGSSGKIGRFFSLKKRKNQVLTYNRNKIKHGIRFDLNCNDISPIIKKYKISIAASTHADEEVFAARAHILLKKKYDNLITIIIPRHVHRVDEINHELRKLDLKTSYHSAKLKDLKDIDIYIVDTFGESKRFYKIAATVFLGGSLTNKGGQNPIEPARYGAKILHGPNINNFEEVYAFLKSLSISKEIISPIQFANEVIFKKKMEKVKKIRKLGKVIFKKTLNKLNKSINYEN